MMHRSLAVLGVLAASVPVAVVAHGQSAPPAARPRIDTAPVVIEYAIGLHDPAAPALLSGQTAVLLNHPASFDLQPRDREGSLNFSLDARPQDDGRLLVQVQWREVTRDGQRISWSPGVLVARGQAATSRVDWAAGGGRSVRFTVH